MAQIRDPRTDPQPGDVAATPDGTTFTVSAVYNGLVMLDDGAYSTTLEDWATLDHMAGEPTTGAGPDDEGPDTAAPDALADVERKARVLCALLDVVGKAEYLPQGHYARVAVEGWLRPIFAGLGPDAPAAPERDPRLDPRVGDTRTWTDVVCGVRTQTVTATGDGVISVEEPFGPADAFVDDLTLDEWGADYGGTASWTAGGAS